MSLQYFKEAAHSKPLKVQLSICKEGVIVFIRSNHSGSSKTVPWIDLELSEVNPIILAWKELGAQS